MKIGEIMVTKGTEKLVQWLRAEVELQKQAQFAAARRARIKAIKETPAVMELARKLNRKFLSADGIAELIAELVLNDRNERAYKANLR
jgi:hypothetical protein